MSIKKGMIFYDNWCQMINDYYDDGDTDAAAMLSLAIVRLYSTGELLDMPRVDLNKMIKYTIMPGLESQIKNYENGRKGGRPTIELNRDEVLEKKKELKTWRAVAQCYGIDEDTLRAKRKEWAHQDEAEKPKNQEEEEEEEEEKENRVVASPQDACGVELDIATELGYSLNTIKRSNEKEIDDPILIPSPPEVSEANYRKVKNMKR